MQNSSFKGSCNVCELAVMLKLRPLQVDCRCPLNRFGWVQWLPFSEGVHPSEGVHQSEGYDEWEGPPEGSSKWEGPREWRVLSHQIQLQAGSNRVRGSTCIKSCTVTVLEDVTLHTQSNFQAILLSATKLPSRQQCNTHKATLVAACWKGNPINF